MFKKIYNKLQQWYWQYKFFKEIDNEINYYTNGRENRITTEDSQHKYEEAILHLKKQINHYVRTKDKDQYDSILRKFGNLVELTRIEDSKMKALRITLERCLFYNGADIKSEKDKQKMISERIGHYQDLRKHKEERELLRQIRAAHKVGDMELFKQLSEKFNNGQKN